MNLCDPDIPMKDIRSYMHIHTGIPKKLLSQVSRHVICDSVKKCKKTTGLAMPPMNYTKVGKHLIYYHNTVGVNLNGKDYKSLLVGDPSYRVLQQIAKKLNMHIEPKHNKGLLKGTILNYLKERNTPEPIMVPIPSRKHALIEAEIILKNNSVTKKELVTTANNILNTKPPRVNLDAELRKTVKNPNATTKQEIKQSLANSVSVNRADSQKKEISLQSTAENARIRQQKMNETQRKLKIAEISSQRTAENARIRQQKIDELQQKLKIAEISSQSTTENARIRQQKIDELQRKLKAVESSPRPTTALNRLREQRLLNMQQQPDKLRTILNQQSRQIKNLKSMEEARWASQNTSTPVSVKKAVQEAQIAQNTAIKAQNAAIKSNSSKDIQSAIVTANKAVDKTTVAMNTTEQHLNAKPANTNKTANQPANTNKTANQPANTNKTANQPASQPASQPANGAKPGPYNDLIKRVNELQPSTNTFNTEYNKLSNEIKRVEGNNTLRKHLLLLMKQKVVVQPTQP